MVEGSSARTDNLNACSGGSSFGCVGNPASNAIANAGRNSASATSA